MSTDTPEVMFQRDRREAPSRHPIVGFGILAAFVVITYGVEARHGGISAALKRTHHGTQLATSSGAATTASADALIVQSAKDLRGVECLAGAKLPLEPACRTEALAGMQHFMAIVKTGLTEHGAQPVGKARELRAVAFQLNLMMVGILPKVQSRTRMDQASDLAINALAQSAKGYVDRTDSAFDLGNPKWTSAGTPGADTAADDALPAAEAPAAEAPPAEAPHAAEGASHEAAAQPAEEPEFVRDPALIDSLVKGVADAHKLLADAGRDGERIQEAVQQVRPMLEEVDGHLQQYRVTIHANDATQQKAAPFVTRVDQARGHLLRAIIQLQHGAQAATPEEQEAPFRSAEDLLEKAADDVKAAQALAKTAP